MKIKGEYVLKNIGDEVLAVSVDDQVFDGVISLTESGAFLWRLLEKDCTEEELVNSLLDNYNVDKNTAISDVRDFVNKLKEKDLL